MANKQRLAELTRQNLDRPREIKRKNPDAPSAIAAKDRYKLDPEYREQQKKRARDYQRKQAKKRDRNKPGLKKATAVRKRGVACCPTCGRPYGRAPRSLKKLIRDMDSGQYFIVHLYPPRVLALLLARTPRAISDWLNRGILPKPIYLGPKNERLWTFDQVQAIVEVVESYDLTPPVDLFKTGMPEKLNKVLKALNSSSAPGLNTTQYDGVDENNYRYITAPKITSTFYTLEEKT